ncbi:outer membrane beta-barrel protein [Marivita sp.]|uniref:outer membrane protein n=1 Tax=Marivita sp. TaxID=2003365 RepID=UPI0025C5B939|nr:outer membrane beta-barrel protein [Marivita sp.]
MKRILLSTVAAISAAGMVHAGGPTGAQPEPMIAEPVTVAPTGPMDGDWTGGYAGLSFGELSADIDDFDDSEAVYGVFGGYDYDFGRFVLGGELDYQAGEDIALGGVEVDDVIRAKLRGGYDFGRTLFYGTVGAAHLGTDIGDDTGIVGGVGIEYKVTDQFSVGGEYLAHRFEDFDDTDVDVDADTVSIRGSFRF